MSFMVGRNTEFLARDACESCTDTNTYNCKNGREISLVLSPPPSASKEVTTHFQDGDAGKTLNVPVDRRMAMAKLIVFYVPERFLNKTKWVPPEERGKLLQFPVEHKKSA